ncbi:small GTP-binding protein domain protein [Lachnospiraceae bacterium 3-1]|nr:small GTP-binding protein domain protein [Lachnospiraceae bacterium 3-1]
MDDMSGNKPVKYISMGLLAHVDAGKTTLSEGLLYTSGSIRKLGRVDSGNAFLDTYELERARGITIFSKQALLQTGDMVVTLLDTPGHVDFSAEMERTLQVLDYGILVISGADGVQGHTRTLWRLLKKYQIPVFLFVNKMDQPGTDKEVLLGQLRAGLDENCLDFTQADTEEFYENAAMCEEGALEYFLEHGRLEEEQIKRLIAKRKIFPCFFGSALKLTGILEFLEGLEKYTCPMEYPKEFGAKVFKITRDNQGNRLTWLKITGGTLKVKTPLTEKQEKVNQIRIYSGEKYESVNEAEAGRICAVTGLSDTRPGTGIGREQHAMPPLLTPVLTYRLNLPESCDTTVMLSNLYQLQEEEPELHIVWDEQLQEIQVQIMGEVQLEILKSLIAERFGIEVTFGVGNILYKETIGRPVEGVGHYEPLRHYAEVHLFLEPGERGSGLVFDTCCSEDVLDKNWQRLVLTHLEERKHRGVLTGSEITDLKITLVAGRAHLKHTEGGDFRQATYRALRQGLMEGEAVLLEPYYQFRLEVPESMIGRAMTDIERMHGTTEPPQIQGDMAVLIGNAPVASMGDYQREVISYTRGNGRLFCSLKGYEPCHNPTEVIERIAYDPEHDLENSPDSVFCAHGAGFLVKWDQVKCHMHVETPDFLQKKIQWEAADQEVKNLSRQPERQNDFEEEAWIGEEEVNAILSHTFDANRREKQSGKKGFHKKKSRSLNSSAPVTRVYRKQESKEEYMLVDGYNVIFAWEDLKELAKDTIDGARGKLLDILSNYQGVRKCNMIAVFDAYRVQRHKTEILDYQNIHVVFTQEAETADQYIEKFAHENAGKYRVTVVTSDGLEQIIIRGQGCGLISAREFWEEIRASVETVQQEYEEKQEKGRNYLGDVISEEVAKQLRRKSEDGID